MARPGDTKVINGYNHVYTTDGRWVPVGGTKTQVGPPVPVSTQTTSKPVTKSSSQTIQSTPAQSSPVITNPLEEVNKVIEGSFQNLAAEVAKRFTQYRSDKPFRIDEVLAQKTSEAKEQIDPYYNETLSDYLLGVTRKIDRGTRDTQDLLNELSAQTETFTGEAKFKLDEATRRAQGGFAESGLFSSGEQLRTQGVLQAETGNTLQDFMRRQRLKERSTQLGLSDFLEDIESERKQRVRDIERSRLTDVEQRKSQLAREAGQQFITGFRATLPPELQAASGFDLLGDLGIT